MAAELPPCPAHFPYDKWLLLITDPEVAKISLKIVQECSDVVPRLLQRAELLYSQALESFLAERTCAISTLDGEAIGTGYCIAPNGLVGSASHILLADDDVLRLRFSFGSFEYTVVYRDELADLCFLKPVKVVKDRPHFEHAELYEVFPHSELICCGFPLAITGDKDIYPAENGRPLAFKGHCLSMTTTACIASYEGFPNMSGAPVLVLQTGRMPRLAGMHLGTVYHENDPELKPDPDVLKKKIAESVTLPSRDSLTIVEKAALHTLRNINERSTAVYFLPVHEIGSKQKCLGPHRLSRHRPQTAASPVRKSMKAEPLKVSDLTSSPASAPVQELARFCPYCPPTSKPYEFTEPTGAWCARCGHARKSL
eukprot:TRINITY_DN12318_c0_g1_i1.p1 TRINITY_DN12318_c0_g1~~TRINITY_DN12318_c0_g1_i1.p1  ORF type:complete len:369 (-),score=-22.57 TRINITY_DN12318_c0_g1_i1:77-1183(-)